MTRAALARKLMDAAVKLDLQTVADYRIPGMAREFSTPVEEQDMRAVDLEIFESIAPENCSFGIIKPNRVRINGVECVTEDTPIRVTGLTGREPLKANITLFVRSLKVHAKNAG